MNSKGSAHLARWAWRRVAERRWRPKWFVIKITERERLYSDEDDNAGDYHCERIPVLMRGPISELPKHAAVVPRFRLRLTF